MLDFLQVITLILVVLAMVPAMAHALELPGKLRLEKEAYVTVQPIYYPGFTIAGMSEPLAILSTALLAILTPPAGACLLELHRAGHRRLADEWRMNSTSGA